MNLLLVDDEPLIIEGIEKLLQKGNLPNVTILKTTSGHEALRILETEEVEVVFSDIKMPEMNGIELAKSARKLNKNIKIVFVSSYDDFNYLKEAIIIGSSDYILKPVNSQELLNVVEKISKEIEEDKLSRLLLRTDYEEVFRDNLLRKLLRTGLSLTEAKDWKAMIDPLEDWGNYMLLYLEGSLLRENRLRHLIEIFPKVFSKYYSLLMEPNKLVVIFFPKSDNYLEQVKQVTKEFELFSIVSKQSNDFDDLHKLYSSMEPFIMGSDIFIKPELIDLHNMNQLVNHYDMQQDIYAPILEFFEQRKLEHVRQFIAGNIDKWFGHDGFKFVKQYMALGLYEGAKSIYIAHESKLLELKENICAVLTLKNEQFQLEFLEIISQLILFNYEKEPKYSPVINQILYLLQKDISNHFSLKILAEQFNMNSAYLGQLFQNEVGVNFNEYSKKVRMQEALKKIQGTTERITVIAKSLGYEDISLFYRHYKKEFGITPNKARKNS
jgi:two-component system response regulator YesN